MLRMRFLVRRRFGTVTFVLASFVLAAVCSLPSFAVALSAAPGVRTATFAVGDVERGTARGRELGIRADMVGISWRGHAHGVQARTKSAGRSWSRWVTLEANGDGPDPGSVEGRRAGTRSAIATPLIAPGAQRVEVRAVEGEPAPRDVRIEAINVTGTSTAAARAQRGIKTRAAKLLSAALPTADAITPQPLVRPRTSWGAVQPVGSAGLADRTSGVVVHHTVSTNGYSCASVPALLRGIQRYHIKSNGWFDIGYNFIVDRCGGVWEARGGGITQAVIGAHTAGFNTGTVGIALLGTHTSAKPTVAARKALQRLIAWRMDVAHVLPAGTMKVTARSGDKFPVGKIVTARAVSGHRDLFPTSCPGAGEYRLLKSDAAMAQRIGGLKVANITSSQDVDPATGVLRSAIVRSVSTDKTALMRIALERSSTGEVLAQLSGRLSVLKLTSGSLAARGIPAWDVRVRVTGATPKQRARTYLQPLMRYGIDPGFVVTTPPSGAIAPGQVLTAGYSLAQSATIGAELYDPATGLRTARLATSASMLTAPTVSGTLQMTIPTSVPTGTYELRIGVAADIAPGRSIKRFTLIVDPSIPPTTQVQAVR